MAWRDTQAPVKILGVDARVVFPILFALLPIKLWKLGLAALCVLALVIAERRGLTVPSALRAVRSWLAGRHRPSRSYMRQRYPVDYDLLILGGNKSDGR